MEARVRRDCGTAELITADSLLFKNKTKQNSENRWTALWSAH